MSNSEPISEPISTPKPIPEPSHSENGYVPPSVTFVNAAAFLCASKLRGTKVFHLWFRHPENPKTSETSPIISEIPSNLPEEYHEFADVFSKSQAKTLAEHCSYDLKIDMEEGKSPPIGVMYSLSQKELQTL